MSPTVPRRQPPSTSAGLAEATYVPASSEGVTSPRGRLSPGDEHRGQPQPRRTRQPRRTTHLGAALPFCRPPAPGARSPWWKSLAVGYLALAGGGPVAAAATGLPRGGPGRGLRQSPSGGLGPAVGPIGSDTASLDAAIQRLGGGGRNETFDAALDALIFGNSTALPPASLSATPGRLSAVPPAAPPLTPVGVPGLQVVPLSGCPDSLFVASLLVGGDQIADVAVDLGGSTLLLPVRSCDGCADAWGYEAAYSFAATTLGVNASFAGTTYRATGELVLDDVAFAGAPTVAVELGVVTQERGFFRPDRCRLSAADPRVRPAPAPAGRNLASVQPMLGPRVDFPVDADDFALYGAPPTSLYRGLMGLGVEPTIGAARDGRHISWLSRVHSELPYPVIALALCDRGGALFVGGYPASKTRTPPFFTPMLATGRYGVALTGLALGEDPLPPTLSALGTALIATDDPHLRLPAGPFAEVAGAVESASSGLLPGGFFAAGACRRLGSAATSDLQELPPLRLAFVRPVGNQSTAVGPDAFAPGAPSFFLTLPATGSYLELLTDADDKVVAVCPRLAPSATADSALGLSVLRNLMTVLDLQSSQVGFAPSRGVCSPP